MSFPPNEFGGKLFHFQKVEIIHFQKTIKIDVPNEHNSLHMNSPCASVTFYLEAELLV
jgi:hypothetical protein